MRLTESCEYCRTLSASAPAMLPSIPGRLYNKPTVLDSEGGCCIHVKSTHVGMGSKRDTDKENMELFGAPASKP